MTQADVKTAQIFEDGDATLMARILCNGEYVERGDLSSITWKVFDVSASAESTEIASGTLVIGDVVWNTLQTDGRWVEDSVGYNFRHRMPASSFPTGDRYYRVEYKFTGAGGELFWVAFLLFAQRVHTS